MLSVTPKQLMDTMRRVWKLRGLMESNPIEGRRFVLEFAEEGDFNHVIKGGPWRYRDEAVMVEALKEGDDPTTVPFTSIPIWAQLKDIPFYLLSKELARELGKKIGSLITIDNNSRGDICEKFLRARVRIAIDQPIRRWILLMDEITNEEGIVSIFYERLPNFCLCCGIIGHGEENCSLPMDQWKKNYDKELGVPPTHPDDPRGWYLPATTGQQARHRLPHALPWRPQVAPTPNIDNANNQQEGIILSSPRRCANSHLRRPSLQDRRMRGPARRRLRWPPSILFYNLNPTRWLMMSMLLLSPPPLRKGRHGREGPGTIMKHRAT
uniref:Uncharacterized protein n=1 Tax=Avena sativa TaxID=4498 RepID=A0ACD5Z993_AVESA